MTLPFFFGPDADLTQSQPSQDPRRQWLEMVLTQAEGVKAQAARLLGVNKDRMKYLCRKHGL